MINKYSHIISLNDAKSYLRLPIYEDESPLIDEYDDKAIERMINSAFDYITKVTNHVFIAQDKTYYRGNLEYINVYDYPINTTDFGKHVPLRFAGFVRFCHVKEISLNVGYTDAKDVPSDLIDCAYQMIKVWYYEAEKNSNSSLIPENVTEVVEANKRFILC